MLRRIKNDDIYKKMFKFSTWFWHTKLISNKMHPENAEILELLMKNDSAILMIVYALFRIFEYINL